MKRSMGGSHAGLWERFPDEMANANSWEGKEFDVFEKEKKVNVARGE